MAVSVDGRITTRTRERVSLGSEYDRRLMDELRTRVDAVIVGAGTVRHDGYPIIIRYDDLRAKHARRRRGPHPINVVLSRALDLPLRSRFFASKDTVRIIFTTRAAPKERIERFARVAEVVVLPGTYALTAAGAGGTCASAGSSASSWKAGAKSTSRSRRQDWWASSMSP